MAVRFDTAADRLTHNGTYPQTSAGFTYTAWIKVKVDRNDYSTWLRLSSGGGTIATLGTDSDGLQGANYFTAAGSALTTTGISIDTWVPVAGSRNASTGAINTFYRPTGSGTTLTGTSPITTSDVTGTPDQICIGGRGSADPNEWFNGEIAYVRIWSAQLTQTEIESEWASATPVRTSNLHSNWPLADATDLTDTVGSKTLSLNGGAITTTTGPALGGNQAIDGVASAASRMSAGLSLDRPFGGFSHAATGLPTTAFAVDRPFGGATFASSSMTAPVSVSRDLAAIASGATDFAGVLGVLRPIAGNASAATGIPLSNFIRLRSLSGSADASATAYGDELFINSGPVVNVVVGGYLSNLLDRGLELVTVFPEEVTFDADGNTWTRAASQGIDTMATIQVAAASGTSSRRAEQDNEGFETEENWRLRFPRQFPYILGAQSKVRWRGLMYSVVGDAKRYNGSRRTAHVEYIIRRS